MDIDPITGRALTQVAVNALNEAMKTLSLISKPVAERLGKFGGDLTEWWGNNFINAMKRTAEAREQNGVSDTAQAHPRIAHAIVEEMTWMDDPVVQDMWAGLLASSCTEDADDDSNLLFVNLLSQMTKLQARIHKFAVEGCTPMYSPAELVTAAMIPVKTAALLDAIGPCDVHRLDRELDAMRHLGLVGIRSGIRTVGPNPEDTDVDVTPTTLALHMYIRANGSRKTPAEFFSLTPPRPA